MPSYEDIKQHYNLDLWDKTVVALAVRKKKITAEQYMEITGEVYTAQ